MYTNKENQMTNRNIEIPTDVQNDNTVQDAAWRLRQAIDSHGEGHPIVVKREAQLQSWIDHSRAATIFRNS
jgi:hypothetical protein